MRFAVSLPVWGYLLAFGAALGLAWLAYARVAVPLTAGQRAWLTSLRACSLLLLVAVLFRPVMVVPASAPPRSLLPLLVDVSRSMRLVDHEGLPRIDHARKIAADLTARLAAEYRVELMTFGESLERGDDDRLVATARRSDLSEALAELADRTRGERLPAVLVLSDGGDTSDLEVGALRVPLAPVLTIGIGSPAPLRDREIVNLTAGEPRLTNSSIDLSVSAVSTGFGTDPVELRVTANGRPVEVRRVRPRADSAPVHEVFTVSPASETATVYTVEVPPVPGEIASENNARSVLVPPQSGRHRILIVEGAPGFEHTFLRRALAQDPGLEIDSVVRKGQNDDGRDTFLVQAGEQRAAALAGGYPVRHADLFAYDAIVFGNVEAEFFTRDQLEMTAEFVATRGGGLLVLGARSFERQGLTGTPLAEALPVDLTDRRVDVDALRVSSAAPAQAPNTAVLTTDGAAHPSTRLALTAEESRARWTALPPLPAVAHVGGPRPGAQVLAVTGGVAGPRPLLVAQRYGQGRAMIFAGEAAWRWRMMRPANDMTYETIWRQVARWLAAGSSGPVTITPMAVTLAGTTDTVSVVVRDPEFKPVANADVAVTVTAPDGQGRRTVAALSDPQNGRYTVTVRFEQAGVYRIAAEVGRGGARLGSATRQILVGGADLEMSEPRLNEDVLRRIALATAGRYVPAADASTIPARLRDVDVSTGTPEVKDVWHNGWVLATLVGLLAGEWISRRSIGFA